MIDITEGIVLHSIPYSETSVIVHIYSKDSGAIACIMGNVRTSRSKSAYFRPLSIINFKAYSKKVHSLQRIHDIRYAYNPTSIYTSVYKANIALFLGELLNFVCTHSETNSELYEHIVRYVQFLDAQQTCYAQSHIIFLIQLLSIWGVSPSENYTQGAYFNIVQAAYCSTYTADCMPRAISKLFYNFAQASSYDAEYTCTREEKNALLEYVIEYFNLHVQPIRSLKTLEILQEVFS